MGREVRGGFSMGNPCTPVFFFYKKKEKRNLKIKNITRHKEGHYIMIKGSIQEEDITIININALN